MSTASPALAAPGANRLLVSLALFAAAFLFTVPKFPTGRLGFGFESIAIAHSLASHGEFGDPYSPGPTGVTAHSPPLYPAFLALLFRLFGSTAAAYGIIHLGTACAHGLHAALLPSLSGILFGDDRPGIWGAVLGIALPVFYYKPQWETMYLAAGILLFSVVSHRLACGGGARRGLEVGIFAGLLALLNPSSVVPVVCWLAFLAWRRRFRVRSGFALALVLGAVLALLPWTWRNYGQFHALFFVRDNLGMELYVSNNDAAQCTLRLNLANGSFYIRHPNASEAEVAAIRRMGEVAYNRDRMATALAWMRDHPRRFLTLTAERARVFWFPDIPPDPWYACSIAFVTLASLAGLILLARGREPAAVYLVAVQFAYPLMYYLVQNDYRFRAPILWASLLGTGYVLTALSGIRGSVPANMKVIHSQEGTA